MVVVPNSTSTHAQNLVAITAALVAVGGPGANAPAIKSMFSESCLRLRNIGSCRCGMC